MMARDTPAKIAILGAGPIGLEAGLYARYLGYDVILLEKTDIAAHVRIWGNETMVTPFASCRSTLGLAAIQAQDPNYRRPSDEAHLTGHQWIDHYLLPLSRTDLLSDRIVCPTTVKAVERKGPSATETPDDPQDRDNEFRVLLEHEEEGESCEIADIVIDATGMWFDATSEKLRSWFDGFQDAESFDRWVADVAFRPDHSIYDALPLEPCPQTGGSIPWAERSTNKQDFVPDRLITTEPHFYVLGAKSFGRDPQFRFSVGLRQIRDLFTIIGDRATLDLYASARFE